MADLELFSFAAPDSRTPEGGGGGPAPRGAETETCLSCREDEDQQPPHPQDEDQQPPHPQDEDQQHPHPQDEDQQHPHPQDEDQQHPHPQDEDQQHPHPQDEDQQHPEDEDAAGLPPEEQLLRAAHLELCEEEQDMEEQDMEEQDMEEQDMEEQDMEEEDMEEDTELYLLSEDELSSDGSRSSVDYGFITAVSCLVTGISLVAITYAVPRDVRVDPDSVSAREMERLERERAGVGAHLDRCVIAGLCLLTLGGVLLSTLLMVSMWKGEKMRRKALAYSKHSANLYGSVSLRAGSSSTLESSTFPAAEDDWEVFS